MAVASVGPYHMQICTLPQTDNHASIPPLSFFTGRMPFLPPNQQQQSTEEGIETVINIKILLRLMPSFYLFIMQFLT